MRGKYSRALIPSLAVALLVGLGGWMASASRDSSPEHELKPATPSTQTARPGSEAEASGSATSPASVDGARAWVPGVLYRYELTNEQQVTFSKARQPSAPGMAFHIQGDWSVGVISLREERIETRLQLRPTSFSISSEGQDTLTPELRRSMTAALGRPFFATLDKTGTVRFVHFEQGTDTLAQALLRTLVAATQFVVAGPPGPSWDMEEFDSTGKYLAAYQRQAPDRFEKTKRAYTHLTTPEGLSAPTPGMKVSVNSRATFELTEELWPRGLRIDEQLEVDMGEGLPTAANRLLLSLRLVERRQDDTLPGALTARQGALLTLPLASFLGQAQDPLNHSRQILGDKRFEDMERDLRSLPKEEKARDDARTLAMERLRALFLLSPAEAQKVSAVLRSGLEPTAASPMIGALSAASTPEALSTLVKTLEDSSLEKLVRADAVAALGVADKPTREGIDALKRTTRESDPMLRDTATLALGNAALQLQDEDARGAESLLGELGTAYRTASSPEQKAMILRALGNTRSANALPVIQDGLRSPSALVREAAVVALRNLPGASVDQLLAGRLIEDPSPEVRKSAVFSCGFRPLPPLLPALQQALQTDSALSVRAEIVSLLGAQRAALPLVDSLLLWASQNDSSPDIRHAATSILNPSARPLPPSTSTPTP